MMTLAQRRQASSMATRCRVLVNCRDGDREPEGPIAHQGQSDSRLVVRETQSATTRSILFSFTRTLVKITRSRGAKQGAIADSVQATLSHFQPPSTQLNPTSGNVRTPPGTRRRCLLSSGSRVRILPGALDPEPQLKAHIAKPTGDAHEALPRRRARCVPDGLVSDRPSSAATRLLSASAMACCRSSLPCR